MKLTWDRGTILLRGDHPASDLPGVIWDERVGAWRAPGAMHEAITAALRKRGVAAVDHANVGGRAPLAFPVPELRPYQETAVRAWELAGRRGLVVLPTGAGKTRVALAAIARSTHRTLCLVPTRVLLDQWIRALRDAGTDEVGRFGDGERQLGPITVATYDSVRCHIDRLGNRFDLLVVDEAHHFGGAARGEILEMSTAQARLGLTATPPDDEASSVRLDTLIGPVVSRSSVSELAGRFLAHFRIVTLALPLSMEERARYESELACWKPVVSLFFNATPEASWVDFVRGAARSEDGRRALAAWRRSRRLLRFTVAKRRVLADLLLRHVAARTLVFAPDAITAYDVSREHLIPVIAADIGRRERACILEQFAAGDVRGIVSARVLNEGIDVPEAGVAILIGGSHSQREYVQRIGRVLRPAEGKTAVVYELVTRGTNEILKARERRESLDSC